MKCPYCGHEVTEEDKFCPYCGHDLRSFWAEQSKKKSINNSKKETTQKPKLVIEDLTSNKKDDKVNLKKNIVDSKISVISQTLDSEINKSLKVLNEDEKKKEEKVVKESEEEIELKQRIAQLQKRIAELNERKQVLEKQVAELADKKKEVEDKEKELDQKEIELKQKEEAMEKKYVDLLKFENDLIEQKKKIEQNELNIFLAKELKDDSKILADNVLEDFKEPDIQAKEREILTLINMCNEFIKKGYVDAAKQTYDKIENLYYSYGSSLPKSSIDRLRLQILSLYDDIRLKLSSQ